MSSRGRAAYRAVYLSSSTKFCTTLHAFGAKVVPRYHVDPWEKDLHAVHKHKWRVAKQRKLGRWANAPSPLAGVQAVGWPDPILLGASELARVAARAQAENLQDAEFWQQLAERTYTLRDVLSVGDLATILDALVTANRRHLQLLKTLTREFIDDADKLMFIEVAVVVNAYAHFNCFSATLLAALSDQATQLLRAQRGREDPDFDSQSVAVLTKAFSSLGNLDDELMMAIKCFVEEHVEDFTFAALSDVLACFAKRRFQVDAGTSFWTAVAAKVPGSRMASLCPMLYALPYLNVADPTLRNALVPEILGALQDTPVPPAQEPLGVALGLWGAPAGAPPCLPAFATEPVPVHFRKAPRSVQPTARTSAVPEATWRIEEDQVGAAVVEWGEVALAEEQQNEGTATSSLARSGAATTDALRRARWYNAVSKRPARASRPTYARFDPSEAFARNRRGSLVADALTGLSALWQMPGSKDPEPTVHSSGTRATVGHDGLETRTVTEKTVAELEQELVSTAAPVLRSSVQGLSAAQLTACSELYALQAKGDAPGAGLGVNSGVVRDLLQESVRKLSNFGKSDLRRLHKAALQAGTLDPYMDWVRHRKFPKVLRQELQEQAAGAPAVSRDAPPRAQLS